jgi:hypothetical protein
MEPGGVFLDLRFYRQEIRFDKLRGALIRVGLGFQPSAGDSGGPGAEIQQYRPVGGGGLGKGSIYVSLPCNTHRVSYGLIVRRGCL